MVAPSESGSQMSLAKSNLGGQGRELGIQYIEFIYQKNVVLQAEISDTLDQMMALDTEHINERQKWENEIQDLER